MRPSGNLMVVVVYVNNGVMHYNIIFCFALCICLYEGCGFGYIFLEGPTRILVNSTLV